MQEQCRGEAGDSGQKSDDDDSAAEFKGTSAHRLNLSPVPEFCRRVVISLDCSQILELDASSRLTLDLDRPRCWLVWAPPTAGPMRRRRVASPTAPPPSPGTPCFPSVRLLRPSWSTLR